MKTRFYHRRELLSAITQAESLSNFRIEQIGCRFVVVQTMRSGHERKACVRDTLEAAEEFLMNKLPAIESEL